jgi:DNA-binding XRE family transcriptional regulator
MGQSWWRSEGLDLGVRLRARRTELQLTREALAAAAQLSSSRIGAVERGEVPITVFELRRLAAVLGAATTAFTEEPRQSIGKPLTVIYETLVGSDEGAALAEAFARIRTPRLRRHLVQLAQELATQDLAAP